MLNRDELFAQIGRHVLAQQQAKMRIKFIHIAHRLHPQRVFVDPAAIAQACCAIVASARSNFGKSVAHTLNNLKD